MLFTSLESKAKLWCLFCKRQISPEQTLNDQFKSCVSDKRMAVNKGKRDRDLQW